MTSLLDVAGGVTSASAEQVEAALANLKDKFAVQLVRGVQDTTVGQSMFAAAVKRVAAGALDSHAVSLFRRACELLINNCLPNNSGDDSDTCSVPLKSLENGIAHGLVQESVQLLVESLSQWSKGGAERCGKEISKALNRINFHIQVYDFMDWHRLNEALKQLPYDKSMDDKAFTPIPPEVNGSAKKWLQSYLSAGFAKGHVAALVDALKASYGFLRTALSDKHNLSNDLAMLSDTTEQVEDAIRTRTLVHHEAWPNKNNIYYPHVYVFLSHGLVKGEVKLM